MRVSSPRTDWTGFILDPKTFLRSMEQECPLATIQSLRQSLTNKIPAAHTAIGSHQFSAKPQCALQMSPGGGTSHLMLPCLFLMCLFPILKLTQSRQHSACHLKKTQNRRWEAWKRTVWTVMLGFHHFSPGGFSHESEINAQLCLSIPGLYVINMRAAQISDKP